MPSLGFGGALPFGRNIYAAFSDQNQDFGDRVLSFINPGPTLARESQADADEKTRQIYQAAQPLIEDALQAYHAHRPGDAQKSAYHAQQIFQQAGLDGVDVMGDLAKIGAASDTQAARGINIDSPTAYNEMGTLTPDVSTLGKIMADRDMARKQAQDLSQSARKFPSELEKSQTEAKQAAQNLTYNEQAHALDLQSKDLAVKTATEALQKAYAMDPLDIKAKLLAIEDAKQKLDEALQLEPGKVDAQRLGNREKQITIEKGARELQNQEDTGQWIATASGAAAKPEQDMPSNAEMNAYLRKLKEFREAVTMPKLNPVNHQPMIPSQEAVDGMKAELDAMGDSILARRKGAILPTFEATYTPAQQAIDPKTGKPQVGQRGQPVMERPKWSWNEHMRDATQPGQAGQAAAPAAPTQQSGAAPTPTSAPGAPTAPQRSPAEILNAIRNAPPEVVMSLPFDENNLTPEEQQNLATQKQITKTRVTQMQKAGASPEQIRDYGVERTRSFLLDYYTKQQQKQQPQQRR